MVKLIMTDIDGTMIAEGHTDLNPEYFEVIRKLTEAGVCVAVASGRHSVSVKNTFVPVQDCITIVSQNGCVIEHNGKSRAVNPIPLEWVKEFWQDLKEGNQIDSILDTPETTFCPYEGTPMHHLVKDGYKYDISGLDGWDKIPEDSSYSMMTIYHPDGAWNWCQTSGLNDKWKDRLYLVSTGKIWVDCMMPGNNKGNALRILAEELGIGPEEVVAFGDNDNDIPMIVAAGKGYAVDTAKPAVKEAADEIIPGFEQDGVLKKMKEILAEAEAEKAAC